MTGLTSCDRSAPIFYAASGFDIMKTIVQFIRRILGVRRYVPVPYEWIISKDGKDIAHLHDPEWVDMFWRRPILTPIGAALTGLDFFEDNYWADCAYQIRHATLSLRATKVIIRGGKAPRIGVRGIPERIPEHEWTEMMSNHASEDIDGT